MPEKTTAQRIAEISSEARARKFDKLVADTWKEIEKEAREGRTSVSVEVFSTEEGLAIKKVFEREGFVCKLWGGFDGLKQYVKVQW